MDKCYYVIAPPPPSSSPIPFLEVCPVIFSSLWGGWGEMQLGNAHFIMSYLSDPMEDLGEFCEKVKTAVGERVTYGMVVDQEETEVHITFLADTLYPQTSITTVVVETTPRQEKMYHLPQYLAMFYTPTFTLVREMEKACWEMREEYRKNFLMLGED